MVNEKKVINSVSSMGLCSGITAVLSIVQFSIVARFLTPEDYGMVAIPNAILSATGAMLAGLPLAVIQRESISSSELYSMQLLLYVSSVLLALLSIGVGFCFDRIVLSEPIVLVTAVLSLNLLITAISLLHQVWARRELNMSLVANANIIGAVIGFGVVVYFAYAGHGYWALVYAVLARTAVSTIYIRYRRSLPNGGEGEWHSAKPLLGFGFSRGMDQFLGQFTSKLDQFLIGSFMGQSNLGLYTVASNIGRRPVDLLYPILGSVLFPIYSRMRQQPDQVKSAYTRSLQILALLMPSIAIICLGLAPEVVNVLLGSQWSSAVPILQVVAFVFAVQFIEAPHRQLANAMGASNRLLVWNVLSAFFMGGAMLIPICFDLSLVAVAWFALVARFFLFLVAPLVLVAPYLKGWGSCVGPVLLRSIWMPLLVLVAVYFVGVPAEIHLRALMLCCYFLLVLGVNARIIFDLALLVRSK